MNLPRSPEVFLVLGIGLAVVFAAVEWVFVARRERREREWLCGSCGAHDFEEHRAGCAEDPERL